MKLLEWNIHKMTNDILVKKYVVDVIIDSSADIIVLTEYLTDSVIEESLNENYYYEESNSISGNKVFIAVKKEFAINGICVKNKEEKKDCYNFLHVDIKLESGDVLSVIGVRMLSPIDATKQTPQLKEYISKLKNPFLCTGDFNILSHMMGKWFPNIAISNIISSGNHLSDSSIVYVDKDSKKITGFGTVDHVLHSDSMNVNSIYSWNYLHEDSVYPCIEDIKIGRIWNIPAAYPDHAVMISEVEFVENE